MISFIKGRVVDAFDGGIVIENGGIGYEVYMPASSALYMAGPEETVTVYTAMMVREDDISLYGFDDRESLQVFNMLLTVNGIGAKAAVSILSALTASEVKKAIAFDDPDMLARAQGVGKKTAQRVVLELKEKVDAVSLSGPAGGPRPAAVDGAAGGSAGAFTDAVNALISLGYTKAEASEAIAASGIKEGTTEEIIKAALKRGF